MRFCLVLDFDIIQNGALICTVGEFANTGSKIPAEIGTFGPLQTLRFWKRLQCSDIE